MEGSNNSFQSCFLTREQAAGEVKRRLLLGRKYDPGEGKNGEEGEIIAQNKKHHGGGAQGRKTVNLMACRKQENESERKKKEPRYCPQGCAPVPCTLQLGFCS